MARQGKGLTARRVETAKPGKYEDGHGLRLVVSESGARKWVFRYTRAGKRVEMGLGSVPAVGLAQAREKAADARRLVKAGKGTLWRCGAMSELHRRAAKPLGHSLSR